MKWFNPHHPSYPKGAEISTHPFFDTLSFYNPHRLSSVFLPQDERPLLLEEGSKEKFCAFCLGRMHEATPEKVRSFYEDSVVQRKIYPQLSLDHDILFRRQANLFEIIPFEYWQHKYQLKSSPHEIEQIDHYLTDPDLFEHLKTLIKVKYSRMQKDFSSKKDIVRREARSFFSGFHDLLCSGRHFLQNATQYKDIFMSGTMTWQEHRVSYEDILLTYKDMIARNPHIMYISTFQNWLPPAGASFHHWHKQILATDFIGKPLQREEKLFAEQQDIYTRFALDTAIEHNLIIAENEHALAYVEVGSKAGCLCVVSKSHRLQPHHHTIEEVYAMSDLVHALCACFGSATPYNEEWYYTPFQAHFCTPWRILLRLRSGTCAGFENINQYLVSGVSQIALAQELREKMAERSDIALGVRVTESAIHHKKSLRYGESLNF